MKIVDRWKEFYRGHFSKWSNHPVEHATENCNQENSDVIEEYEVECAIEKIKIGKTVGRNSIAP